MYTVIYSRKKDEERREQEFFTIPESGATPILVTFLSNVARAGFEPEAPGAAGASAWSRVALVRWSDQIPAPSANFLTNLRPGGVPPSHNRCSYEQELYMVWKRVKKAPISRQECPYFRK